MAVAATKKTDAPNAPADNTIQFSSDRSAFSKEQEAHAYREMLFIRRFEEKAGQLYGMGLIGGFCHLYIGQEAVVVGVQMAMKEGDQVITGYRDHGHMLATGMEARGVMAELTGRRSGYSRGKGGSMHMFSKEKKFYGGHGIVGAQVSLGTGLAFANHYRNDGSVAIAYFGDGASNQGQVYESFNMAELWRLPIVYVIENNRYAMGTSVTRSSALTDFSKRGSSFNIPGAKVNGMDVRAVKAASEAALGTRALRQGALPAGDGNIPLSRALHVGPRQIPIQGRARADAQRARSDRAGESPPYREEMGERGRAEEDRRRCARRRQRCGRFRDA